MATYKLGNLQLLFGLGAILVGLIASPFVSQVVAAILILSVGLLHGSYDLQIMQAVQSGRGRLSFWGILVIYLGILTATIALYLLFPAAILIFFILVSAYHFGEQHWTLRIPDQGWDARSLWFVYGSFILSVLFYLNYDDVNRLLGDIAALQIPIIIFELAGILSLVGIFLMAVRISLSRKRLLRELLHLALIVLTFALFDVLYAFAIYFVIWHSLPSIYAQIVKVNRHFTWRHLKRYCLHALPIYLVSLLFIVGIMWFFTTRFDQMESYVLSPFIALTMAHAVLFAIFLQMPAVTKSPSE